MPNYPQLQPKSGYPQLTAYRSYDLPSFDSGDSAISYMKSLGFNANYGLSNSIIFTAPSKVIASDNVNKDNKEIADNKANKDKLKNQTQDNPATVTLSWDTIPTSFDLLLSTSKEITLIQINNTKDSTTTTDLSTKARAKIQTIKQNPCQLILINVQGTFTTTAQISVNYIDTGASVPDPARTDEICMMVYSAVNSINTNFPETINTITPTISICFLNPTDTGFNPNSTAVQYLNSDSSKSVVSATQKLSNGNIGIYFTTVPANFAIIPLTALGNTQVFKDSPNSGTLVQILPGITSGGIGIELKNVTGVFLQSVIQFLLLWIVHRIYLVYYL